MVSLEDLEHLVLGVVGSPVAYALGQCRGGQTRFDPQTQLQGMKGTTTVPTRFVESAPQRHRPTEGAYGMRMFVAAAIETAFERHLRRGLAVSFGLQAIESPGHDPSSHLT
jgi:hypothetical protein